MLFDFHDPFLINLSIINIAIQYPDGHFLSKLYMLLCYGIGSDNAWQGILFPQKTKDKL